MTKIITEIFVQYGTINNDDTEKKYLYYYK